MKINLDLETGEIKCDQVRPFTLQRNLKPYLAELKRTPNDSNPFPNYKIQARGEGIVLKKPEEVSKEKLRHDFISIVRKFEELTKKNIQEDDRIEVTFVPSAQFEGKKSNAEIEAESGTKRRRLAETVENTARKKAQPAEKPQPSEKALETNDDWMEFFKTLPSYQSPNPDDQSPEDPRQQNPNEHKR